MAPSLSVEHLSVFDSDWQRQESDDGRMYFFNRATGASQWHIPNELYRSCLVKKGTLVQDLVKFPGSARAVLGVDCVTEKLPTDVSLAELLKKSFFDQLISGRPSEESASSGPLVLPRRILEVTVLRATGLRDADFMPGLDKSDPFCVVEVAGKEQSRFSTVVVQDCLDPIWNHKQLLLEWEEGDSLDLSVWDQDECDALLRNSDQLSKVANSTWDKCFNISDTLLGKIAIGPSEIEEMCGQESEMTLEDAGEGIDAKLVVSMNSFVAWPSLEGAPLVSAVYEIERCRPGAEIIHLEAPGAIKGEVVSYDVMHFKNGYAGNFVGVYFDEAEKLQAGDKIDIGESTFTFVLHNGDKMKVPDPSNPDRLIVYLFLKEDIKGVIKDGTPWCKVTQRPAEDDRRDDRVYVFFDPKDNTVVGIPMVR